MRRHELAMHGTDLALSVDIHHGAIQAVAAAVGGTLNNAEVDGDLARGSCFADVSKVTIFYRNGLTDVVRIQFLLQLGFEFRAASAFNPEWVAGQQSFTEGDQIAAFGGGSINPFNYFRGGRVALQPDWRDLRQSDFYAAACQSKPFRNVTP
jgi:hypothetical protein